MSMMTSRFSAASLGLLLGAALSVLVGNIPATEAELTATATFAGGCFWCMVHPFDELPGVVSVLTGYTGGHTINPTYKEVSAHTTGHIQSIQIVYHPDKIQYEKLLDVYWHNVDPLDSGGQFCDRGNTYTSVVFYHDGEQQRLAEQSKTAIEKQLKQRVVTEIRPAGTFYAAEGYHQNFYQKNPFLYTYYRYRCGRDQRLEELWGKKG